MTALVASGLPCDRFLVMGFLPRKGTGRAQSLALLGRLGVTCVLYEAGNRVGDTLSELHAVLGDREAALARELTKLHEEIVRGPLSDLARRFPGGVRGEATLVVAGASATETAAEPAPEPLEAELLRRLAAGQGPSAVAREVARARGLVRSEVYAVLERLRKG